MSYIDPTLVQGLDDLTNAQDSDYGSPENRKPLGGSIQGNVAQQAANTLANPFQSSASQYGLKDEHLGPANQNGVRPVLDSGYKLINNGIKDNSSMINIGQSLSPTGSDNTQDAGSANIIPLRKGKIGSMFDQIAGNAGTSAINSSAVGSGLNSAINSGISSILAFL